MHRRRLIAACALSLILAGVSPAAMAAPRPDSWDGLALVKSKRFDSAYLLPGADFRDYSKVMLDPTEVSFQKDWLRDYNRGSSSRIAEAEAQAMTAAVRSGFEVAFRKAYADAGYQVVTAPAADVLRVRTAVVDLFVAAPDNAVGRSNTYSETAGGAIVVVEVRDSLSGALLGRAVDGRTADNNGMWIRNRVTNTAAFNSMFRTWARISVDGLAELKARSPIPVAAVAARK